MFKDFTYSTHPKCPELEASILAKVQAAYALIPLVVQQEKFLHFESLVGAEIKSQLKSKFVNAKSKQTRGINLQAAGR